MLLRQLFDPDTSTYTYLLADALSGEAVLIDPVAEQVERDIALIDELGLSLRYSLETHVHADHVTGSGVIRERLGCQTGASSAAGVPCADVQLTDGKRLKFGRHTIEARHTPGHTDGCVTYVVQDGDTTMAFTGDALFVRGCGRTDFQQGSSARLYDSVHRRIYSLPDNTLVYPGHDYKGATVTTVGEEKAHNPRLGLAVSAERFDAIMSGLNLAPPRRLDEAVPANLACGRAHA